MKRKTLEIIKTLISAFGVTGDVEEVQEEIKKYLEKHNVPFNQDSYGILTIGDVQNSRVMFAAHIDEIGFQISKHIEENKFRVLPVGAVSACQFHQQMVEVKIGKKKLAGSIFSDKNFRKPVSAEDFDSLVLYIDGEYDKNSVIGSFGRLYPRFKILNNTILSTTLDNRVSIMILLKLIVETRAYEKGISFAFITDEEMEDHSADSLGFRFSPEFVFIFDYCPVHQTTEPNENLGDSDTIPLVMYRGGRYVLHKTLRDYFDSKKNKWRFAKGFLSDVSVHQLEPSNFEINGKTKAVNICIPAYGYHGAVYRMKIKAVEEMTLFAYNLLNDFLNKK